MSLLSDLKFQRYSKFRKLSLIKSLKHGAGLLGTGLMVLIFASIFTSGVSLPQLSFGCVLMAGYVVYDTQLIVEKYNCGDTDFIWQVFAANFRCTFLTYVYIQPCFCYLNYFLIVLYDTTQHNYTYYRLYILYYLHQQLITDSVN